MEGSEPSPPSDRGGRTGCLSGCGDIGTIDEDGYVRIVGRRKELIINAAGKDMSPANIEATVKSASPLIGQCVAIGDRRPYNIALIVLDPDATAAYAARKGLADAGPAALAADPEVQQLVADAIERANEKLARIEQIKRHTILPTDWLPDSDELTPHHQAQAQVRRGELRRGDRDALPGVVDPSRPLLPSADRP